MCRVLVVTCLRTGRQGVQRDASADRALAFLAGCRPMEVRQVYDRRHRQIARAESLCAGFIDTTCDEVWQEESA